MKYSLLILAICSTFSLCSAQTETKIEYHADNTVRLNGNTIHAGTSYDELVGMLGEPIIYKEYPTGKTTYHFKDRGVALSTVNGKLLRLGVNYNWDGDKNFPESTFDGLLTIGSTTINKHTTSSIIEQLSDLKIKCIIPDMCMNNPKTVNNPIMLGFQNEMITQVSIEFH